MSVADMIGFEQGRLKVARRAGTSKDGKALWECQCSCGNKCFYTTTQLRSRKVMSCGCIQREKAAGLAKSASEKRTLKNGSCLDSYKSKVSSASTSGIKGVTFHRKSGKWLAQIRYAYKNYYLGVYEDIGDAAAARRNAEDFIRDNFDNPDAIITHLKS